MIDDAASESSGKKGDEKTTEQLEEDQHAIPICV